MFDVKKGMMRGRFPIMACRTFRLTFPGRRSRGETTMSATM